MRNIEMTLEKNELVIKVDLTKEYGQSKSGKTVIIASSQGNIPIPNTEAYLGLNIYKYPENKEEK